MIRHTILGWAFALAILAPSELSASPVNGTVHLGAGRFLAQVSSQYSTGVLGDSPMAFAGTPLLSLLLAASDDGSDGKDTEKDDNPVVRAPEPTSALVIAGDLLLLLVVIFVSRRFRTSHT